MPSLEHFSPFLVPTYANSVNSYYSLFCFVFFPSSITAKIIVLLHVVLLKWGEGKGTHNHQCVSYSCIVGNHKESASIFQNTR